MTDSSTIDSSPIEKTAERDLPSSAAEEIYQQPIWSELRPEIVKAVKQQTNLRFYAFITALFVLIFAIVLEIVILNCILTQKSKHIHVAIVVAPIISFTAIAIAILIGFYQAKLIPWAELFKSTAG